MPAGQMSESRVPLPHFSTAAQLAVSALWFAWFGQWFTIPTTLVQTQIAAILGVHNPILDQTVGLVLAAGATMALIIPPLAGALSDRSQARRGRRRPFLIAGVLGSSAALAILGLFGNPPGPGGNLLLYGLAYVHLQFWWNWAAGPYAGLIPDVVPDDSKGMASGWMNVLGILGVIAANLLMMLLYHPGHATLVIAVFIAINLLCLAITLIGVREPPPQPAEQQSVRSFLRGFWLPPTAHPNFYLVLATRLFSNLGIWSVFGFLVLYMQSVFGLTEDAANGLFYKLIAVGAFLGLPASLIGIKLTARYGLVPVVQVTSWVMAAATFCYVLIAMAPAVLLVIPAIIVFSIANGAYGATDWLLALRVLPSGPDAGKDFGIWHVSMVLPQIIGPFTMGFLISSLKISVSGPFAYMVAFAIATFWFVLAAAFVGRIRLSDEAGAEFNSRPGPAAGEPAVR
ncbi:MAG: MFS transporter [Acetobacteraceae bacterium]